MSELKPGSMALIIKAYTDQSLVGKVVEVHSKTNEFGFFRSPITGKMIMGQVDGYVCIGDIPPTKSHPKEPAGYGLFARHQLMPIDGEDFIHEDDHQKELTHG